MDTLRFRAHGLVSKLRRQPAHLEWISVAPQCNTTNSTRRETFRSAPRTVAQISQPLGSVCLGLSCLSRTFSQRAIPVYAGRQQAHLAGWKTPERTRHWMGNRPRQRMALGNDSLQLFSNASQSPHCRCHYESELVADPTRTPES